MVSTHSLVSTIQATNVTLTKHSLQVNPSQCVFIPGIVASMSVPTEITGTDTF